MAGAAGMSYSRFLGWNLLGALVSCFLFITLGYIVGNHLDWVVHVVKEGGLWIAVAIFLSVVVMVCILWWRKRHRPQRLA